MRKSFQVQTAVAIAMLMTLIGPGRHAEAAPVTVLNPSFEIVDGVDRGDTWNSDNHDDWIEQNTDADIRTRSVGEIQGTLQDRPNPHEDVWFTLDTRTDPGFGGVYQNVGTIAANTIYTLDILVGERYGNATPGGVGASGADARWGLYTGSPGSFSALSTQTASTDLSAAMKADNGTAESEEMSLMWDSTGSGFAGQDLYIRFFALSAHSTNETSQILFDNVRLDASAAAVPTPTALPAGLMLMTLAIKRRRSH